MKHLALIVVLFCLLFPVMVISQEDELTKRKIGKNELIYQYPASLGYAHTWHIKDKFIFGTALQLGYGSYIPQYTDFLFFDVFSRNPFSSNKYNHLIQYEIGGFVSMSFQGSSIFYGLLTSFYFDFNRFKIGAKLLSGEILHEGKSYFPRSVLATPIFVYKFN